MTARRSRSPPFFRPDYAPPAAAGDRGRLRQRRPRGPPGPVGYGATLSSDGAGNVQGCHGCSRAPPAVQGSSARRRVARRRSRRRSWISSPADGWSATTATARSPTSPPARASRNREPSRRSSRPTTTTGAISTCSRPPSGATRSSAICAMARSRKWAPRSACQPRVRAPSRRATSTRTATSISSSSGRRAGPARLSDGRASSRHHRSPRHSTRSPRRCSTTTPTVSSICRC